MSTTLKTWIKRGAKTLGVLLLLVLVIAAGALLYLETRPGKRFLKNQILGAAGGALAGSLELGRIEGNLLGGVELYEIVVRDARGNIVAMIPSATAEYSLTQFVRGELKLDEIHVEEPLIIAHVYPDGVLNLTQIAKPSEEASEPSTLFISLVRAKVTDATLLYYDQKAGGEDEASAKSAPSDWFKNLNKKGEAEASPAFSELIELTTHLPAPLLGEPAANASLTMVALSKLGLDAKFNMYPGGQMSGTLAALDAEFSSNATKGAQPLSLKNIAFLQSATRLEASLERLSLGDLATIDKVSAGIDFDTEPDALGNPVVTAPSKFIAEVGALRVEDGLLRIFAPDAPVLGELHASVTIGGELEEMKVLARAGCGDDRGNTALTLGGSLSFPENMPAGLGYNVALLINDLNALDCVKLDQARTNISGAVLASGRGVDPAQLRANAAIALSDSTVGDYKISTLYLSADAADAKFALTPLVAVTPYGRVEASGNFDLNRGDYQVQLDADANPEVRELLKNASNAAMQTEFARVNLKSKGTLDLDAPSPVGKIASADLQAKWQIKGANVEAYKVRSTRGELDIGIKPGAKNNTRDLNFRADLDAIGLDTPPAKAQFIGAKANGSGTISLPVDDILAALENLSSTWELRTRDLRADGIRVSSADITAKASRSRAGAPFAWSADGTINGARFQDNRLKSANLDLRGTLDLEQQTKDGATSIAPGNLTAAGRVSARGISAGSNSVESAKVDLNVRGRLPNISGRVDVDAQGIRAGAEEIENLDAAISLSPGRQFEVHANATRVIPEEDPLSGAELNEGETPAPRRMQQLNVDARGKVSSDFQKFDFDQLELGSPEMSFSAPPGASVNLRGGGVRLSEMTLQSGETSISARGQFRTRGREDFHLELTKVELGELREKFELQSMTPPVRGEINGSLDLVGTAREPIITVDLTLRDVYYEGYGPFDLDLKGHYEKRRLHIDTFELSAYSMPVLSASGEMPLDLNLSGKIRVPLDQPVKMHVTIPEFHAENFYSALPLLEDNKVQGSIGADINLRGTVENPNINLIVDVVDAGFSGEVGNDDVEIDRISTQLRGTYRPPSVGRGGISMDYELSWRGKQIIAAYLSSPVPIAQWVRQTLDENAPPIDFSKALDNVPLELALKIAGLNLNEVPIETFAQADAAGTVTVGLNAIGTFSDPRANFSVRLDGLGWDQYRDIDVLGEMSLRDQVLRVDQFRVDWTDDPILSAEGEIPVPTEMLLGQQSLADLPIKFKTQLNEFALKRLSVIDYEFAKYKGVLAAYFQVDGTLSRPTFQGRAGLFNTKLAGGQLGTVAFEFQGGDDRIQVDGSVCRNQDTMLDLQADLPITTDILQLVAGKNLLAEGEISGSITSQKIRLSEIFPEELVSNYITDPKGTLAMDLSLSGDWKLPKVLGSVNVHDAAVTLSYFGRRFTGINLDVTATNNQVLLRELRVNEEDSFIAAKGDVQFIGIKPTTVKAEFESKEFNIGGFVPNFNAFITSNADISGDLSTQPQRLHVDFTKLNVTMPESQGGDLYPTELDDELIVLSRQRSEGDMMNIDKLLATTGQDAAKRTRTKIRVTAGRNSWLHHPIVDVNFKADVTATLGGPAIEMTGSVGTIRGTAEMIGKQFDIPEQENAVRFTGDSPPDPALDVRALHILDREITAEIGEPSDGEPRIIIRVRGRATEPSLILESDPPLSETEILYVLMTGRAPSQAGAGEESRVSSLALSAASGIFAGMLQERLSGTLPLDVVRLQPGEDGFNDLRVQIGKYVTDDIFVSYVLRLGADEGEGMNVIKLDYRFLPAWKLGFQLSNQLNGELNVFWDIY
ncbi:translocation/assembly module TamB domain-containing protein [Bradymonas sediminis]|uniref:Translocation and assembly module TamB C-terminal domain-containing protein n=1 Tax=Bradymonas sediminis TaxID=1548548 RepID=A0A2Z4FME9_9DELT|nr:translocation/assembly module TamB domain-containing protein [Bradymonas sediminis]AWV90133.1 hypothetical protein DN745_12640 [Bradymonas sediminis]TDP75899.1 autotransporter translocation and assembly factor TamB [Bradymonas sediminis]